MSALDTQTSCLTRKTETLVSFGENVVLLRSKTVDQRLVGMHVIDISQHVDQSM